VKIIKPLVQIEHKMFPTCRFRLTINHFLSAEKGHNLVQIEAIVMLLAQIIYFVRISKCVNYEAIGTGRT
jgi:hypothetical protein